MSEADKLFFIEQMDDTVLRIGEMFAMLAKDIAWMKPRVARIEIIEQDIKTIKWAITETNRDLAATNQKLEMTCLDLAKNTIGLAHVRKDLDATNKEIRRQNDRYEKRFLKIEHR